jgi:hypothetical protein
MNSPWQPRRTTLDPIVCISLASRIGSPFVFRFIFEPSATVHTAIACDATRVFPAKAHLSFPAGPPRRPPVLKSLTSKCVYVPHKLTTAFFDVQSASRTAFLEPPAKAHPPKFERLTSIHICHGLYGAPFPKPLTAENAFIDVEP